MNNYLVTYSDMLTQHAPSLWKHDSNKTTFILELDDFGVQFLMKTSTENLTNVLKDKCEALELNWKGGTLFGMRTNFD